jgi:hypothetical protein
MLEKYKNKFNIKMIILTDNSIKKCGNIDIKLSLMLILLTGDTWYGKYGFRPIKITENSYSIDYNYNKYYEKNKEIINKTKISDINLLKYINLTKNDNLIKATDKIIKTHPNMLLKDFLSNLIKDYDKNCNLFILFYEKLYYDLKLFDFYKKLFGLFL